MSDIPIKEQLARVMARKTQELEARADYQERKRMTQHERSVQAIEKMAKDLKEGKEKCGQEVSWDSARREMVNIAEQADRGSK